MTDTVHVPRDLEDLIPEFLERRQADVAALRAALERRDAAPAQVLGHQMRGSGAGYGFQLISELGAEIQQAATAGDWTRFAVTLASLEQHLARLQIVYVDQE